MLSHFCNSGVFLYIMWPLILIDQNKFKMLNYIDSKDPEVLDAQETFLFVLGYKSYFS